MATTPLLRGHSQEITYLTEYALEEAPLSGCQKKIKKVLQALGTGITVWGQIPFIAVTRQAAERHLDHCTTPCSNALIIGNSVSFGVLTLWSINQLLDEFIANNETESVRLKQLTTAKKVLILSASGGIAISANLAITYAAMAYNDNNPAMGAASIADVCIGLYSAYGLLRAFALTKTKSPIEQKIDAIADNFRALIRANCDKQIVSATAEEKAEFLSWYQSLDKEHCIEQLFQRLTHKKEGEEDPGALRSRCYQTTRPIIRLLGITLGLSQIALVAKVAYDGGVAVTGRRAAGYAAGTAETLANIFLMGFSSGEILAEVADFIYALFSGRTISLEEQINPKLIYCLNMLSLVLASLAWGPNYGLSADHFEGRLSEIQQYVTSVAVVVLSMLPLREASRAIARAMIEATAAPSENKTLLTITEKLHALADRIPQLSHKNIAGLLLSLSAEQLETLLTDEDGTPLFDNATLSLLYPELRAYYNGEATIEMSLNAQGSA